MSFLFGLADANNFYVECERVFQPQLNHKPVIVLSNNDGCIVARSNEAKLLGITMGIPVKDIQALIKKNNIAVRSSNYALYGDMSNRFATLLERYTDQVEVYSIDESFLGFDGFANYNLTRYCQNIVQNIRQGLGLPICIGLAPSKTLAKVANRYAKLLRIPGSVLNLSDRYSQTNALKDLPVQEVWGIGARIGEQLNQRGIHTALQLRDADAKSLRKQFSVNIERTIRELRGEACIQLEEIVAPKKQIVCSRSFGKMLTDIQPIREAIAYHVTRGCVTLRQQHSFAHCITVGIRTNPFSKRDKQYAKSITIQLPQASDDTSVFLTAADCALRKIYQVGYKYKKAGIMIADICDHGHVQQDLFHQNPGHSALMPTLDHVNLRYGKGTLRFGMEGIKSTWVMNSNKRSCAFTTRWSEIISVH